VHPPALVDILRARQRLSGRLSVTPLVATEWLTGVAGAEVRLKLESLQISHSFKVRGALNALLALTEQGDRPHIVTASAGNHGRAIAWAAEQLGLDATVFTPRNAPRSKLDAIRRHGAELRAETTDYEEAERRALDCASTGGMVFISPYNHPDVIAGAGTIGLELIEQWPELQVVIVPVGGGGLVSGITLALKAVSPSTTVVGVEAEASGAFTASRQAGRLVRIDVAPTIADGLGGNIEPDSITWPVLRDQVDHTATVSETALGDGIRRLMAEEHLIAEGAGIAGIAAVASGTLLVPGRRTAIILTGSNIDSDRLLPLL
jgi:threonine dehydratase